MQSGNWRAARDTVVSMGTGVVHVIQLGNWRGHVMQLTHHKTYYTT